MPYDNSNPPLGAVWPADSPPSASWAEPPRQDYHTPPLGRTDPSTPVRWRWGRTLTGDFGNVASARDSQGTQHRLYNPEEIERAGGYQPDPVNPNTGFVTGQGDQIGSMQETVDELNRRNPYQLAYMDRGGIRITRPVRRGGSPQETQAALGAVEAAKEQNRGLTFAGMEASYRDALASGDTQQARRMAERMYRLGAPPQQMRDIANEVQEANKPLATPELGPQDIMDLHQRMSSSDPTQWGVIAAEYAGMGHHELASTINQAANAQIAQRRNQLTGRSQQASLEQRAREFDVSAQQKQQGLRETQAYHSQVDQRAAATLQQREDAAAQAAQDRQANRGMAATRLQNTMDQQQRAGVNRRVSGIVSQLTGLRKHYESLSVGGVGGAATKQEQQAIAEHALDQAFGDNPQLHSAARAAYESMSDAGDPLTAAAIAMQSVIGRATAPMTPASPSDEQQAAPAAAPQSSGQLNFGDY